MKIHTLLFISCLFYGSLAAQDTFRVLTYNVENLFDTRHDSLKNDLEFLPESTRHWTPSRFRKKLDRLARCIIASGQWQPPALVALCEVENKNVLERLTRYSALKEAGYNYVLTDSPDERGINVALLYQPADFRLLYSESHRIRFPAHLPQRPTRDILHVCGKIPTGDTLDLLVVHLPSQRSGEKESEPARFFAASVLHHLADSLVHCRRYPLVMLLGDFNAYPKSRLFTEILHTAPSLLRQPERSDPPSQPLRLYNLTDPLVHETTGTYKYQGEWGILDHILVNGNFLRKDSPLFIPSQKAEILRHDFLLQTDPVYLGVRPFRTYYGYRYHGGYSDHLPVAVTCVWSHTGQ